MADAAREIADKRQALDEAEKTHGAEDARTADARESLAYAYQDAGLPEQASPLLEQAIRDFERINGERHQRTIIARKNLGNSYYASMRIDEARPLYVRAAAESAEVLGESHICTMVARSGAAACLQDLRRFDEAIAEYESLVSDWDATYVPEHRSFLRDRLDLAKSWDGSGDTQEAMSHYRRLRSDFERMLGPGDALTQRLSGNLEPQPRPWRSEAGEPLETRKLWLLSLSAIHMTRAHCSVMDALYPRVYLARHDFASGLESDWGATSREDLQSTLEWLAYDGHRTALAPRLGHVPVSWDLARYAYAVRAGYAAEYITEQEAWKLLELIAGDVTEAYGSWREYAEDYLAARLAWLGGSDEPGGYPVSQQQTIAAVSRLLDPANTRSPWNLVPWDASGT